MGTGDFIAQTLLEKNKLSTVDYWRTANFFGIGFVVAVSNKRKRELIQSIILLPEMNIF